jgi:hypothetical protein
MLEEDQMSSSEILFITEFNKCIDELEVKDIIELRDKAILCKNEEVKG